MRWVQQEDPDGCGVAVFAMLTGRTYAEAVEALGFESAGEEGTGVPNHTLVVTLMQEGHFIRRIFLREHGYGGWPPAPFARLHWAMVTQPSGNGHYVAMDHLGVVLDPMREGTFRLDQWKVISEVCGVL